MPNISNDSSYKSIHGGLCGKITCVKLLLPEKHLICSPAAGQRDQTNHLCQSFDQTNPKSHSVQTSVKKNIKNKKLCNCTKLLSYWIDMEYGKKTGNVFENGPFISTSRISKIVKACSNRCYDVLPYTVKKNIFMSWKVFPLVYLTCLLHSREKFLLC